MKTLRDKASNISGKVRGILERAQKKPVAAFILRVAKEVGEDNAGDMAAGIAYYSILSIFPLLLGIIALLGLFLPSETVQQQIFDFANQYIPGSVRLYNKTLKM